jgi:glycosyltransferase involved in cell wall biosynthesis
MGSRGIMKKILCFIDSLGAGGAQRQMVGLAVMLKEKGYNVKVLVYHDNPFFLQTLEEAHIDVEINHKATKHFSRIYYICKSINSFAPDVVISYLDTPNIIASICKMLGGKFKLIVSERNTTQKITFLERLKFFLFYFSDFVVPNSYTQERFIFNNFANLKNKVKTIVNFTDIDYFFSTGKFSFQQQKVIVVVATIWPPKNVLGFIEAINILKEKKLNFKVDWYGKTSDYDAYNNLCENKISQYNLKEIIIFHDKTKDIKQVYEVADIFCLPSFYEGTPNALCEAISMGLPVVCSNVCDNPIYVEDGENGYLFDPYNPNDIALKLEKLLSLSNCDYERFSINSRKKAEKKLSPNLFIRNYQNLIEELVD